MHEALACHALLCAVREAGILRDLPPRHNNVYGSRTRHVCGHVHGHIAVDRLATFRDLCMSRHVDSIRVDMWVDVCV